MKTGIRDKAASAMSTYIRIRDCLITTGNIAHGSCYTCTQIVPRQDADAGHFVSGRNNAVLFDPRGVHLQCRVCNQSLGGNPQAYETRMLHEYGPAVVDELRMKKWQMLQLREHDYRELIGIFSGWSNDLVAGVKRAEDHDEWEVPFAASLPSMKEWNL